jgi:hypothetical protein
MDEITRWLTEDLIKRGAKRMKMIHNIKQLAEHLGVPACFQGEYEMPVERAVYKSTECGCTFSADQYGIDVAGYAEGADAECPTHRLEYPFSVEAFWLTVMDADQEGIDMWNEWNTDWCECPSCKEIALRLVDEEISEDNTMSYSTYVCRRCGYIEVHSGSLPSWYNES